VVAAVAFTRERVLEFADATSERLTELGQALRPKHNQRNHKDYAQLKRSDIRHALRLSGCLLKQCESRFDEKRRSNRLSVVVISGAFAEGRTRDQGLPQIGA
jgi:hypothetical protein